MELTFEPGTYDDTGANVYAGISGDVDNCPTTANADQADEEVRAGVAADHRTPHQVDGFCERLVVAHAVDPGSVLDCV